MIWHIFKKDVRLLWWLAAAVAALRFTTTGALLAIGRFPNDQHLVTLMQMLALGSLFGAGFLIATVVHQDAIPGVRQDWLIRPIRRRDLFLAKLLFTALLAQGPVLLSDFAEAAINGFPLSAALASAASRSVFLFLGIGVPFLAFASITRNLLETVTGGAAIFFAVSVFEVVIGNNSRATVGTGSEWITVSATIAVIALGAAAVLSVQFLRRRTVFARGLTGALVAAGVLTTFLPWKPVFALQKSLAREPGAAGAVTVSFDPALGRFKRDSGFPIAYRGNQESSILVFLPLRTSGLPGDSGLQSDRAQMRVIESNGRTDQLDPSRVSVWPGGEQETHEEAAVPAELYKRIKDQPVRIEIAYSLTLFRLASTHTLPAVNGDEHIAGVGWCGTRINVTETAVQFRCQQAGRKHGCLAFVLQDVSSGEKNPERIQCDADYAPYIAWQLFPDSLWRSGTNLPFRDPAGLTRYPVDGSKLGESQAVMRVYEPADHFSRTMAIPEIKLSDWEAQ